MGSQKLSFEAGASVMEDFRRILFIRTDRIGDVLMNLPAIHQLRQSYPKAWISFLADDTVASLVTGQPDLDEVMPVKAGLLRASLSYRFELVRKIRKAKFDLAVVSNPDKWLHGLVFLAGIRTRVGYRRKWPFLLTHTLADDKASNQAHEIDSNLNLVRLVASAQWDGKGFLMPEPHARESVTARLKGVKGSGAGIIAIHGGTSHFKKRWNPEGFAVVAQSAAQRGLSVILIGGVEEKAVSEEIAKRVSAPVTDWTGSLSLQELVALFHDRRVRALVSCDSGPVHVAWMSGTPVVALYAQNVPGSDPARWGPRDGRSEVIYKPTQEIMPQEVLEKLEKVLRLR